jgi:hypothetical protein
MAHSKVVKLRDITPALSGFRNDTENRIKHRLLKMMRRAADLLPIVRQRLV